MKVSVSRWFLISLVDILIWVSLGSNIYQGAGGCRPPQLCPPLLGNIWPDTCYHKFISFAANIWRVGANPRPPLQLQDYNSIVNNIRNSLPHSYDKVGKLKTSAEPEFLLVGGRSFAATLSIQLANFFVEIHFLQGDQTCSVWDNVIDVMMGIMENVRHHSGIPGQGYHWK